MNKLYVQYGCGLSAPAQWENYDVSPTLRIQKIPVLGDMLRNKLNTIFPGNVKYGDIVKGLPVEPNSCDGVYCSHTLEHLSFNDCKIALQNTYTILKNGGVFRCVVPDLEEAARTYIRELDNNKADAGNTFIRGVLMGSEHRKRGIKQMIIQQLGNAHHLWMWDRLSLQHELREAGFTTVRLCCFNDSSDAHFQYVEDKSRFMGAIAFEAIK